MANNRLHGDVRAHGQFKPEPGGTRVHVRLDIDPTELLVLPLFLVVGVIIANYARDGSF